MGNRSLFFYTYLFRLFGAVGIGTLCSYYRAATGYRPASAKLRPAPLSHPAARQPIIFTEHMDVLREGDGGLGIGLQPIRNPEVTRPRLMEINSSGTEHLVGGKQIT